MSTERKVRQVSAGEVLPPLTRLKQLSPEEREAVVKILETHTYELAQSKVEALVGFACSVDTLGRFFPWAKTHKELEGATDETEHVHEFIGAWKPDWTIDNMASPAIGFLMMLALKNRDTKEFSRVARIWLRKEQNQLARDKYNDSRRQPLDIARAELEAEFARKPEASRLFREAKEALRGNNSKFKIQNSKLEEGPSLQSVEGGESPMSVVQRPKSSEEHPTSNESVAGSPSPLQTEREKLCQVLRRMAAQKAEGENSKLKMQNEKGRGQGSIPPWRDPAAERKVRKVAVYRQCKCFCTSCNSKSGVTVEEAGATSVAASSHVDIEIRGCLCVCERCQAAERELWIKRFARYEEYRTQNEE